VFLEGKRQEGVLLPELGTEVSVGGSEGVEDGLDEVTHGTGVTTGARVAIGDTGHGHELLSGGGRNQSGTARSRDQTNTDGSTLSGDLAGDGVGQSGGTSPISSSDWDNVELGGGNGPTNGRGNLRRTLDTETDVSRLITDGNKGLESGALTGGGLLLDGHDLHDLVLELVLEEVVNNFGFLDGNGKEEDLFDASDLSLLDQTSELGDGDPDVLVTSTASSSSTTTAASSTSTASSASAAESSSSSFLWGLFVTHLSNSIKNLYGESEKVDLTIEKAGKIVACSNAFSAKLETRGKR